MTKPLPAADLAGAFGKSRRAADLRLPPAKKSAPDPSTASPRSLASVAGDEAAEAPHEPQDGAGTSPGASVGPPEGFRDGGAEVRTTEGIEARGSAPSTRQGAAGRGRLVLWTPVSIRTRMQAVQAEQGTLYLDQVLDALETTLDQLPELVAKSEPLEPPEATSAQGRLFQRSSASGNSARRCQLTIPGLLTSQLEVIDDLVASTGAPSRSALVNAALNAALPPA